MVFLAMGSLNTRSYTVYMNTVLANSTRALHLAVTGRGDASEELLSRRV